MEYEVTPEQLQDVWPKVRHWIAKAIEYGTGDEQLSDVFLGIARGVYGLWYSPGEFAAVYQVWRYPRQTVATIVYCGGDDLHAIKRTFECAEHECARRGIDMLRVWGRPGWERALGFERTGVILQKRVAAAVRAPQQPRPEQVTMQ